MTILAYTTTTWDSHAARLIFGCHEALSVRCSSVISGFVCRIYVYLSITKSVWEKGAFAPPKEPFASEQGTASAYTDSASKRADLGIAARWTARHEPCFNCSACGAYVQCRYIRRRHPSSCKCLSEYMGSIRAQRDRHPFHCVLPPRRSFHFQAFVVDPSAYSHSLSLT